MISWELHRSLAPFGLPLSALPARKVQLSPRAPQQPYNVLEERSGLDQCYFGLKCVQIKGLQLSQSIKEPVQAPFAPPLASFCSTFLLRYQQGSVHYLYCSNTEQIPPPLLCYQLPVHSPKENILGWKMKTNFMSILQLEKEGTVMCPWARKEVCWGWVRRSYPSPPLLAGCCCPEGSFLSLARP